jgi:5-formyltetrahydrofolate cyclo-ligase
MSEDRSPLALRAEKSALRRAMEIRRASVFAENPQAAVALRDHFKKTAGLASGAIVAGYIARGSEIDPAPLIEMLRAAGHKMALPVMAGKDKPLLFRLHEPGAALVANAVGIPEPSPEEPLAMPDVLLVPLLAFDRLGGRLGTGGGYYDRTIQALRRLKPVRAIGLAFACQELPEIPHESHDAALDSVVTELQVFNLSSP